MVLSERWVNSIFKDLANWTKATSSGEEAWYPFSVGVTLLQSTIEVITSRIILERSLLFFFGILFIVLLVLSVFIISILLFSLLLLSLFSFLFLSITSNKGASLIWHSSKIIFFRFSKSSTPKISLSIAIFLKIISFLVNVPVLSLKI